MPPILWVFFVAQALAHTPTLVGAMHGVDPTARLQVGSPATSHMIRTLPMYDAKAVDEQCHVTLFVVIARGETRRLNVDGVWQNLDWSWSFDETLPEGSRKEWEMWIVHPVTHESEYYRKSFHCRRQPLVSEQWLDGRVM